MSRSRRLALGIAACALLAHAPTSGAQHFPSHALTPAKAARPLHARLAAADAVAIGVVERIEEGRIHITSSVRVIGTAPDAFAVKRAPSSPPPLAPGDRAVFFLRGARSPYLLVDETHETIVLASPDEAIVWLRALVDLDTAVPDGDRMQTLYTGWIGGNSATLRRAGLRGLADESAPFWPPGADVVRRLVALAGNPEADDTSRTEAALVAAAIPGGAAVLLASLPGEGERAQPEVLATALRVGLIRREPTTADAFRRAIRSPDPRLRIAALSLGRAFTRDPAIEDEVAALAASDPDETVRATAAGALTRRRASSPTGGSPEPND